MNAICRLLPAGHPDYAPGYCEDITLSEAAMKLGFLTGEQFDSRVRPEEMTHPHEGDRSAIPGTRAGYGRAKTRHLGTANYQAAGRARG
jgi:hypothetical protein